MHDDSHTLARCSRGCAGIALSIPAADRRPIADTDLYSFQWVANPRISPDGSRIVYTHVVVNQKHDGYDTALWIIPSSGGVARQLTGGPRDSSPQWSPDGKLLAFVRATEKDGKPQPAQIYLLAMEGGEARPLTDLPKGAGGPQWSPDGRAIAFSSTNVPADFEKKKDGEEKSDVRVIAKAVYRANGSGLSGAGSARRTSGRSRFRRRPARCRRPPSSRRANSAKAISCGRATGRKIYFTSRRVAEPYYETPHTDIYSVKAAGGEPTKIAGLEGGIQQMALSPGRNAHGAGGLDRRRKRWRRAIL